MDAIVVPWRRVDSILDKVDALERQIAARAYELFERRGGASGRELDDWLVAENLERWTPALALYEQANRFIVKVAIAGVEPEQLDVRVTPDDLLIEADVRHEHGPDKGAVRICEFAPGTLFRRVHFPQRVDPDKVRATLRHGLLLVTAPIAHDARPVEVH
jgi:HSP20 family protein